ncbi:MAG: carbohydrate-binding family V/XII [Woeseiaceae bacterium]
MLLLTFAAAANALDWPQEIDAEEGTIVVYQPQPERLDGNVLTGRAAMSLELEGRDPIFGAFWFESRIDVDREAGTALIRSIRVTDVRWPDSKDAGEQRFTAIVEEAVPANGFEISFERLSASLETAELERRSLDNLKNDPPEIIFRDELSVLVLYDGEPRYSAVEGSDYERVLNTPVVVVRRKGSRDHYLSSGRFWYESSDPMGPWTSTNSPPNDLVRMLPEPDEAESGPATPPAIVTADVPTELISTQGEPEWQPLQGGDILYVANTESPWLRDLSTNNMYVLLSGRWYRSKSADGPWTFVPSDELPASFANIPPASDIGGLRTSVAGTPEAEDAVLDAQIPQTAAIKRSEASLTVEYDGSPDFERIPGTAVSYAVNTGAQVLEIDNRYYAVDNGVWFTAASATGPWAVADSVPQDEISKIPPSSPVYNTTHVHVYESTPDIVYVGYTPGYLWSFPYYGVPVYGTGWRYPPYYGRWYYPRPPTWGMNVGYNPWTGWNFGMSWSNGFFNFGISWGGGYGGRYRPWRCCNGWYGGGHRGPIVINTGDINIGNTINVGNRVDVSNKIGRDRLAAANTRDNVYKRPENRARVADRSTALAGLQEARPATGRPNDVFADRSGNIARDADGRWETRENGNWRPATGGEATRPVTRPAQPPSTRPAERPATRPAQPSTRPAQRPATRPSTRPARPTGNIDRAELNRARAARQRGTTRQSMRPAGMQRPARRR